MNGPQRPTVFCKNLNHGRSNVSINYCPECGTKFPGSKMKGCGATQHADYRKQRFLFCMDCGQKLASATR